MCADVNISFEINRRICGASASIPRYSSQPYDRPNTQLSSNLGLLEANVVGALWNGRARWTLCSEGFDSLRIAHPRLLLRVLGFPRKDRTGLGALSYRPVLEMTNRGCIVTTIRKRQVWFAGALATEDETYFPEHIPEDASCTDA